MVDRRWARKKKPKPKSPHPKEILQKLRACPSVIPPEECVFCKTDIDIALQSLAEWVRGHRMKQASKLHKYDIAFVKGVNWILTEIEKEIGG